MAIKPKRDDSVFQLISGVTVETFKTDEEFRSGRVHSIVAGKARIVWDGTGAYEYLTVDDSWTRPENHTIVIGTVWDGTESGHLPRNR
jgi:hypothetical protein